MKLRKLLSFFTAMAIGISCLTGVVPVSADYSSVNSEDGTTTLTWDFGDITEKVVLQSASAPLTYEYSGLTLVGASGNDEKDYVSSAGFHCNGTSTTTTRYIKYTPAYSGTLKVTFKPNDDKSTDRITAVGTSIATFKQANVESNNVPDTVLNYAFSKGDTEASLEADLTAGTTYYVYFAYGGQSITKLTYTYTTGEDTSAETPEPTATDAPTEDPEIIPVDCGEPTHDETNVYDIYSRTITKGESVTLATVAKNVTDVTDVTINNPDTNNCAEILFVPAYHVITATGKEAGTTDPIIISAGQTTVAFTITVIDDIPRFTVPPAEALTPTEQPLFTIDFENSTADPLLTVSATDGTNGGKLFDEYGSTMPFQEQSPRWTYIKDTANLTTPTGTMAKDSNSLSGNAFYSYLNPSETPDPSDTGTTSGNGYRGSRFILDNEKVQRTDKVKVSYDFAFYNVVKTDTNAGGNPQSVGIPLAISMTSEAVSNYSIPYDFNELSYSEIDADPSNPEGISKHILTFFTGRPKRNDAGTHWTDMTNTLAFFDPLSASEDYPYGKYRDLGLSLTPNAYNYFHVDAEIDFYNSLVEFTVTDPTKTEKNSVTMTTTIPKYASWNGFIIASNKWDNKLAEDDTNGQDTEHYAYLDNITATKIAVDDNQINPETVPSQEPIPVDAVVETTTSSDNGAWLYNQTSEQSVANLKPASVTGFTDKGEYVDYTGETESINIMPYILDGGNKGVTSYTEFDFYLPKKGSYATIYLTGSRGGGETVGNTITISDAGINSWYGNENYQTVCGEDVIECGQWYRMQIIFDDLNTTMQINVKRSGADTYTTTAYVGSRNLSAGYYRAISINSSKITTGDNGSSDSEYVSFPVREPSMATTYIANLRVYNRAVLREYYDYGTTADQTTADAVLNNATVNSSRLGTVLEYVTNQVQGEDGATSVNIMNSGNNTINTKNSTRKINSPSERAGKTFAGWRLIYSNGTGATPSNSTDSNDGANEGTNANRLKYAAIYIDDPTGTPTGSSTPTEGKYYMLFEAALPSPDAVAPYDSIQWTVTQKEEGTHMTGIWKIEWGSDLPNITGGSNIVFGYGIYKIPVSVPSSSISVSAHAGFGLSQDRIEYDELKSSTDTSAAGE